MYLGYILLKPLWNLYSLIFFYYPYLYILEKVYSGCSFQCYICRPSNWKDLRLNKFKWTFQRRTEDGSTYFGACFLVYTWYPTKAAQIYSFASMSVAHCASKRKKENHQFQKKISQITLSYPNMTISYQFWLHISILVRIWLIESCSFYPKLSKNSIFT